MDARDIRKIKSENDTKTDRSPDRIIDNNMNKTVNKSARVVMTKNRVLQLAQAVPGHNRSCSVSVNQKIHS